MTIFEVGIIIFGLVVSRWDASKHGYVWGWHDGQAQEYEYRVHPSSPISYNRYDRIRWYHSSNPSGPSYQWQE